MSGPTGRCWVTHWAISLDYYSELLDRYHFPDPSYESDFEDYLVRKYGGRTIDLLIANGPDEAALAGRLQARLPSQPPIVFIGLDARRPVPKSTGHTYRYAMKESLDLALRVHPDTRHVFVVCGASPLDAWYEDEFRSQVPAPPRGVEFTFLRGHSRACVDRSAGGAAGALHCLSGHAQFRCVTAGGFGQHRCRERLASASNAPIYTWNGIVPGVFGGRLLSTRTGRRKDERNSHCACYAASDPRTFRSPPSTRVSMRSIGVSLTVGTSAKPVSPLAWSSGFANPGCSSSTAATFSAPSACCHSRHF